MTETCTPSVPSQDSAAILVSGRTVFEAESKALALQATQLNGDFVEAVKIIVACHGRVIVSGMGKSGHIAKKMAATFASTGTPAFFVHPGEASHGDLGMITANDVVIAISNSGESKELGDIIAYAKRFAIPLISITSKPHSALGSAADILLLLPQEPEVGALGLAPTTSTTMTLALGDALAVATLELRGFTAEDFSNFHPGGKLGKNLLRIENLMHAGGALPLVKPEDTMAHVLVVMTEKRFGCAGVVDASGKMIGIITDGDLRRHMSVDLPKALARDIMTPSPMVMSPRLLAVEAIKTLNEKNRTQVFIVDERGLPVGILHIHDLLRAGIV
ncbi:MAG: KpsF/GutQ family sugar-phosphate isomerase [Proteobacteria bacterium]|jgi:arabinose-5-phosphate isomerase|nr:KpsF/GutQ family sugar-phosphate isomerase [Alphaproteobacteria bacterium]NCC02784.1 KpsF/GutQ family sugar-phosphate isomerase [Pseudomonadota bacterium]